MDLNQILKAVNHAESTKGFRPNTITFYPLDWELLKIEYGKKINKVIRNANTLYGLKVVKDASMQPGRFIIQEL